MRDIELLVETYLDTERDLEAAVDAEGGAVQLSDRRTVSTGRADDELPPYGVGGRG